MRRISYLVLAATAALFAAACSPKGDNRPQVVVQSLSLSEDFQRAVEEQCPDINIKWFLSRQVHDNFYNSLGEDIPDILMRSAYYINENKTSYLRDISERNIINNYSRNLIENFRHEDGEVLWLPVFGNGYTLMANTELFEKYGIPLPTDYESLKAADREFKEHGIDGVSWPLAGQWQYEAMLVAQILCADLFNSYEGMKWRDEYRKSLMGGGKYIIDEDIWPEVFRRFREAVECDLIDEDDFKTSSVYTTNNFRFGKTAMLLCATEAQTNFGDFRCEMLPTFDTKGNAWLPIYMKQSYAVSSNVSEERMADVMKVFDAIRSEKSFKALNESRGGLVPLNNDPSILGDDMQHIKPAVTGGYTFLLFNENSGGLVDAVYDVFRAIRFKGIGVDEACRYCKERTLKHRTVEIEEEMNDDDSTHVLFTSDVHYPVITDEYHNSPANSCLANTTLAGINDVSERKFDILLLEAATAGGPVTKGNYYTDKAGRASYASNICYMFNVSRPMYPAKMTVADLIQYLNTAFYYFHRIDDGLPVMAGASYVVDKYDKGLAEDKLPFKPNYINSGRIANLDNYPVRYVCTGIEKDGVPLPADKEIDVLMGRANMFYITEQSDKWESGWVNFEPAFDLYLGDSRSLFCPIDYTLRWLMGGHSFCEPTRYVTINEVRQ